MLYQDQKIKSAAEDYDAIVKACTNRGMVDEQRVEGIISMLLHQQLEAVAECLEASLDMKRQGY